MSSRRLDVRIENKSTQQPSGREALMRIGWDRIAKIGRESNLRQSAEELPITNAASNL